MQYIICTIDQVIHDIALQQLPVRMVTYNTRNYTPVYIYTGRYSPEYIYTRCYTLLYI